MRILTKETKQLDKPIEKLNLLCRKGLNITLEKSMEVPIILVLKKLRSASH